MITEQKIDDLATKLQTSFVNVGREYVQARFLSYFYQHEQAGDYFFKGGTALRLLHDSPRFSEDLDFSSTIYTCRRFEDIVSDVLVGLDREDIAIDILEAKKTTWGCLTIFSTSVYQRQIEIKTDVSLRKKELRGETVLLKSLVSPSFSVRALLTEQLVREKLQALLKRGKARDYFDLYYILRARTDVLQVVPYKEKIIAKLEKMEAAYFAELVEFLPKSYNMLIKDFKSSLMRELTRL